MSIWSYVHGTITVEPMGRTQPEKQYVLDTALNHLPRVSGSERDMNVYTIQKANYNSSMSCDEFGMTTDNLVDMNGDKSRRRGWLRVQTDYILAVDGALRDCTFDMAKGMFIKWLTRLAKRVQIHHLLVEITSGDEVYQIRDAEPFLGIFEDPTWVHNGEDEPNWCEFMLWDRGHDTWLPVDLEYKYFNNPENDEEYVRRQKFMNEDFWRRHERKR